MIIQEATVNPFRSHFICVNHSLWDHKLEPYFLYGIFTCLPKLLCTFLRPIIQLAVAHAQYSSDSNRHSLLLMAPTCRYLSQVSSVQTT